MSLRHIFSKSKQAKEAVDSAVFKKSISSNFVQSIRNDGWKGSGFNFHRVQNNKVIELVSFYPSNYGKTFYIEVGIHFNFIDLTFDQKVKEMTTASVDICTRINPIKNNTSDWKYPKTIDGLNELNKNIKSVFLKDGKSFFDLFKSWETDLINLQTEDLKNYQGKIPFPTKIRAARILAYINLEQNNLDNAIDFANYGLGLIDRRNGLSLKPDFDEILKST